MKHLWSRRALLQLTPAIPLLGQSYYYGKNEPLPRQIELAAGAMTMILEPDLGFLRSIRYGNIEIIRGIYAAVRDREWGTVAPRVSRVRVDTSEGAFRASFDVECKEGPIDFLWSGEITGDASNRVEFRMEGDARSSFMRNRIGFCVLHPLRECAGKPCTVRHGSGTVEKGTFPLYVAPNQPFKDVVAISHQVAPGVTAEVKMEGETFEMEDHRNWTDASYKTYCTPLDKPYPVEVKQGTHIAQSLSLQLTGARTEAAKTFFIRRKEVAIEVIGSQGRPLPRIGLGGSPNPSPKEQRLLTVLHPAHLRMDGDYKSALSWNVPLEVAIHLTGNAEAELKAAAVAIGKAPVARYLVFHKDEKSTSAKWVKLARQHLTGAPIGAGTDAYFAELNRGRPETADLDFLCFSANPQVHAFDNSSLVENLAGQAEAVNSARQFAGGKGIVVSPITFKPRFNPAATGNAPPPPPPSDPRQTSLFGAAWTVGSIKYLAESGSQSITYYETSGPRGVMTKAGAVYPLFHVLADVNEMAGGEVMMARSTQPLSIDGIVMRKGNRMRVLIANMTPEAQAVRFNWPGAQRTIGLRKLDEFSLKQATDSAEAWRAQPGDALTLRSGVAEVALAPYAVARLDSADA